ncbi:hypothetical protein B0H14DRAFT_3857430 [Mycena olivaceomarginata]|nr:hypothetical protein B0H14DRAFT_3857430 [Mycena olivaceomarginata]
MKNFNVKYECNDARDDFAPQDKHHRKAMPLCNGIFLGDSVDMSEGDLDETDFSQHLKAIIELKGSKQIAKEAQMAEVESVLQNIGWTATISSSERIEPFSPPLKLAGSQWKARQTKTKEDIFASNVLAHPSLFAAPVVTKHAGTATPRIVSFAPPPRQSSIHPWPIYPSVVLEIPERIGWNQRGLNSVVSTLTRPRIERLTCGLTLLGISRSFCGRLVLPGRLIFTWVGLYRTRLGLAVSSLIPTTPDLDTASSSTQQRPHDAPARAPNRSPMVNAAHIARTCIGDRPPGEESIGERESTAGEEQPRIVLVGVLIDGREGRRRGGACKSAHGQGSGVATASGSTVPQKRKLGMGGASGSGGSKARREKGRVGVRIDAALHSSGSAGGDAGTGGGEEGAGDDIIRCICGSSIDDGFSIACDGCGRWCHCACFAIAKDCVPDNWYNTSS